jgi:hypothetical protein
MKTEGNVVISSLPAVLHTAVTRSVMSVQPVSLIAFYDECTIVLTIFSLRDTSWLVFLPFWFISWQQGAVYVCPFYLFPRILFFFFSFLPSLSKSSVFSFFFTPYIYVDLQSVQVRLHSGQRKNEHRSSHTSNKLRTQRVCRRNGNQSTSDRWWEWGKACRRDVVRDAGVGTPVFILSLTQLTYCGL